jgi:hypothetical protein
MMPPKAAMTGFRLHLGGALRVGQAHSAQIHAREKLQNRATPLGEPTDHAPMMGGMPDVRMDALFPPEDRVAQWVFALSLVVDDLMALYEPMQSASELDDMRRMMSVYRQMVTRLYEARRLVVAIDRYQDVAEFLGVEKKPALVERLRTVYVRAPGEQRSQIERLYADLRHRSVHYPWVGKQEMVDLLRQVAHVPVELRMEDGEMRANWTEIVAALWTLGMEPGSSDWIDNFNPRRTVLMNTVASWIMLWPTTLLLYARRRGVDLARIIDLNTLPPDVRPSSQG